jgi:all-trans-retinol 13,14-reductase
LIFEHGRVAGVRVNGESIRARTVISGIGARETYTHLVPSERAPAHAARIQAMPSSCSMFALYLALDRAVIDRFGLSGVNYWVECRPFGIRQHWTQAGPPPCLLLSLAHRFQADHATHDNLVLAEVFTPLSGDHFTSWRGSRVRKRGPEYDELKAEYAELTLGELERTWPGFRSYLRYSEGATPLTIESFTQHLDGAAYGLAPFPGRYNDRALRAATGVPGLYLTGQDVGAPALIGAFYGGIMTASAVIRSNMATRLRRQVA